MQTIAHIPEIAGEGVEGGGGPDGLWKLSGLVDTPEMLDSSTVH